MSEPYGDWPYSRHSTDCDTIIAPPVIARYKKNFPNFCTKCKGTGLHILPGTRYYFDGSGEPDFAEYCPDCIGQNKCPRCGAEDTFGNDEFTVEGPFTCCGFNFQPSDGLPYPDGYECSCGLDDTPEPDRSPFPRMPW